MFWSAIALIVPFLGNQFVEGWNWGVGEFVFAWVFWVVMSVAILFATRLVSNTKYRIAIGIVIFLLFAFVWGMLATG